MLDVTRPSCEQNSETMAASTSQQERRLTPCDGIDTDGHNHGDSPIVRMETDDDDNDEMSIDGFMTTQLATATELAQTNRSTSMTDYVSEKHLQTDSDVWSVVLSFLDVIDLAALWQTSRRMRGIVSTTQYLHQQNDAGLFSSSPTPSSLNGLVALYHHGPRQQVGQSITTNTTPQEDLTTLLQKFPNLTHLCLGGGGGSGGGLLLAPVGDDVISILNQAPAAQTIQQLDLQGLALSYWCTHSLKLRHLVRLTLGGNSIRARLGALVKDLSSSSSACDSGLRSLTLRDCPSVRDDDLLELGRLLGSSLEELALHNLKIVRPAAQFELLKRAKFCGCFHLRTLSKFQCDNLTELSLSFCVKLTGKDVQRYVERTPQLRCLVLVKCAQVQTLTLHSNKLERLTVNFCHSLKFISVICPLLSHVEVRTLRTSTFC